MAVFYNDRSGYYEVASQSLNPVAEAKFLADETQLHLGLGWHEYGTIAEMQSAVKANNWPAPTNNLATAAEQGSKTVAGSILPSAWHLVFGGTTGLLGRILKVAFGSVLIILGIARMTGAKRDILQLAKGAVPV